MRFAPQRRSIFPDRNLKNCSENVVRNFSTSFHLSHDSTGSGPEHFSASEVHKVARTCAVLCILTCKCALPFFQIGTSKIAPRMCCFAHFNLQMCFAPQRRAGFQHLKFKKWPGGVLCILTCKCASRHSCVPFLEIGPSKIAPRMRCFVHFDLKVLRATAACDFWTSDVQKFSFLR